MALCPQSADRCPEEAVLTVVSNLHAPEVSHGHLNQPSSQVRRPSLSGRASGPSVTRPWSRRFGGAGMAASRAGVTQLAEGAPSKGRRPGGASAWQRVPGHTTRGERRSARSLASRSLSRVRTADVNVAPNYNGALLDAVFGFMADGIRNGVWTDTCHLGTTCHQVFMATDAGSYHLTVETNGDALPYPMTIASP